MKRELETRFYSVDLETREEDDGEIGVIYGRPIVYNSRTNLGPFDEVIEVGALDNADLNDVRLCLNHDTGYVYARSRRNNANNTMRLIPNGSGLDIEADLAIGKSPKAQDYYSAAQRGDMSGMSFMFSVDDEEWEGLDTDHPLRRIRAIASVVEVSMVTFPAYQATSIGARSSDALENAQAVLERARRSVSPEGDKKRDDLELLKLKTKLL